MLGFELARYLSQQQQEALGNDNKWFCSKHFGYEINDPNTLIEYYIKHGGASHFCQQHAGEFECSDGKQSHSH